MAPGVSAVVLAFAHAGSTAEPGLTGARVVDLVNLCCEAWHNEAICTSSGGGVYALLPHAPDAPAARLTRFADDIVATVRKATRINLHVGIGTRAGGLDEAPGSRRSADRVLRVLAETAGDDAAVATEERVRSRIALLDLADRGAAAPDLLVAPVRRMIDHDAAHGTAHVVTLLEFLDAFGETAKAAAALSVHENTLRYRIRRLQELFGVDLSDPADRLVIWLQLRLWHRTTARPGNAGPRR
jgi:sugar diacid utilization regulator